MNNTCEWVLPSNPPTLICLGPEYMGQMIESLLPRWSISLDTREIYNWGERITATTKLTPGMRISFLSPLIIDPKTQRRLRALNT